MTSGDPIEDVLACIARLRAAIAAEEEALAELGLDRLEALADRRQALDRAWGDVLRICRAAPEGATAQLDWARRQMLADLDALRRRTQGQRPPSAVWVAALEALAATMEDQRPVEPGTVVPLRRAD